MSVQAIAWVLDHSPTRGTDRLVLLAIANHAGTSPVNGAWESWPGIATIAREAGLDRTRTAQLAVARLEATGRLRRVRNAAPDDRIRPDRRPNLYRIPIPSNHTHGMTPTDTPHAGPPDDANRHPVPLDGAPPSVTPSPPRGDAPARNGVTRQRATGCRNASPEPSLNRQENRQSSSEQLARAADRPDDDDRASEPTRRADAAAAVLAQRDLDDRRASRTAGRVADPDRWLTEATGRRRVNDGRRLRDLANQHPDATADQLADRLEPPAPEGLAVDLDAQRAAARTAEAQTTERNRALRNQPTDPETLRAGTDAARAALDGRNP